MLTHSMQVTAGESGVIFEATGSAVAIAFAVKGFDGSNRLVSILALFVNQSMIILDPDNPSFDIIIRRFAETAQELTDG